MIKYKKEREENSGISLEETKKVASEEIYCFPDFGIVIKATSRKEAEEKLSKYLSK